MPTCFLHCTAAMVSGLLAVAGCAAGSPPAVPPPTGVAVAPPPACSSPTTIRIGNADQLSAALNTARPGSVITLSPGVYPGTFTARAHGTAQQPIALCGGHDAVLDGGDIASDYTLHLDGASFWQLSGFTIRGGQKGLMIDRGTGDLVQGLLIENVGDEALHLRQASTDNVVRGNEIKGTGLKSQKFGEGIYVGSAESNWCEQSSCGPDRSDRNTIEGNTISNTTAENVDIKEGTTGGVLRGNSFSGVGMKAADAWVNVKGNGWTIADNTGVDAPVDGFQTHQILDGWGMDNTFTGNKSTVNGDGYAINITKPKDNNRVTCSNTDAGAAKGLSSVACV